jgi:hypothetical protein
MSGPPHWNFQVVIPFLSRWLFHDMAWKSIEERGSRGKILATQGLKTAAGTFRSRPFALRGIAPTGARIIGNAWKTLEKFGAVGVLWDIPRGSLLSRGLVAATGPDPGLGG